MTTASAAMCSRCGYLGWCRDYVTQSRQLLRFCHVCRGVEAPVEIPVARKPAGRIHAVKSKTPEVAVVSSNERTPDEILADLNDRFAVNTTARSLPSHMASPPPAPSGEKKGVGLAWFRRPKTTRGADGQFKPSRAIGR